MISDSLSFYSNVFGFIAGGISLLGLVIGVCRQHLPSNKLKKLETLLHETEGIFKESVEAGLLVPGIVERTEERLTWLKVETCGLRARGCNAMTLRGDFTEFFKGTSKDIGLTCQLVKKLQAEVITSSEERRQLLRQMNTTNPVSIPVPQVLAFPPAAHPASASAPPLPSTTILRPACYPALSTWRPQPILILASDFSGDDSRSSSELWSADVQN